MNFKWKAFLLSVSTDKQKKETCPLKSKQVNTKHIRSSFPTQKTKLMLSNTKYASPCIICEQQVSSKNEVDCAACCNNMCKPCSQHEYCVKCKIWYCIMCARDHNRCHYVQSNYTFHSIGWKRVDFHTVSWLATGWLDQPHTKEEQRKIMTYSAVWRKQFLGVPTGKTNKSTL